MQARALKALAALLAFATLWLATTAGAVVTETDIGHTDGWPVSGTGPLNLTTTGAVSSGDFLAVDIYEDSPSGGAPFPTASDPGVDTFHYITCQAVSNGSFHGQEELAWTVSNGFATSSVIATNYGNSGEFVKVAARKITGTTFFGVDKSVCGQLASGSTTIASGALTPTNPEPAYGFAIVKGHAGAFTQAASFSSGGSWSGNNANDPIDGFQASVSTSTNYNPTTAAVGADGGASILILINTTPPPFNPKSGGLTGMDLILQSTNNDGCNQAPAVAKANNLCLQTFRLAAGEYTTANVDMSNTLGGAFRDFFDDCLDQNGTTGSANTTLAAGGASITYGDNSGAFQGNRTTATCKGTTYVGKAFGGGFFARVIASWTAASVAGDWQAPIWFWAIECDTAPAMPQCNFTGQNTNFSITSASYVSATGVLTVTAPATTLTQFGTAILTGLTGTGAVASLNGTTCTIPNVVSGATSYVLNCASGLGTLAVTGGNSAMLNFHLGEFDETEMFMGNFGDPLTQWQSTNHEWEGVAKATNYFFSNTFTPGQASFSSPHEYGILWKPATAGTQGSTCSYYDEVLQACQFYDQFVNNGTNAPPPSYTIAGSGNTYVSGTGVITLTLTTSATFTIGKSATLSNLAAPLIGNWPVIAGTTGTTLVLQGPVGQGAQSITGGTAAQGWAFGIADLLHFKFYDGCTNPNKCTETLKDVWQANDNGNIQQR